MIIARSPLRISLGGGGTDLESYYSKNEGFLIAGAINKYIYVSINKTFTPGLIIKYSEVERVSKVDDIKHPIIREAIKLICPDIMNVEIISSSDIPAGTGLGSSGCFTNTLIKALLEYNGMKLSNREIAEMACDIEINKLGAPIGKQDQFITAIGDVTCFEFDKGGNVHYYPLNMPHEDLEKFEKNLLMFFTGYTRSANEILGEQDTKSKTDDSDMITNLDFVKQIGFQSKEHLELGELSEYGMLLHEHWLHKKKRSSKMSNPQIDKWYDHAIKHGALGGKLIGAGGGGFLLFYTPWPLKLKFKMQEVGLEEVEFKFVDRGTEVIVNC